MADTAYTQIEYMRMLVNWSFKVNCFVQYTNIYRTIDKNWTTSRAYMISLISVTLRLMIFLKNEKVEIHTNYIISW